MPALINTLYLIVIPQYTYPVVDDPVILAPMLAYTSPGTMHGILT